MRLREWARAPFDAPPPIPFDTPCKGDGYAIPALPPEALADDLADLGLTYATGRGNGYRLKGRPVNHMTATDPIAALLEDAAATLRATLAADPVTRRMRQLEAERARLALPVARRDAAAIARLEAIDRELAELATRHEIHPDELAESARRLARTARAITASESARYTLLRRVRDTLKPATRADLSVTMARAYLDTMPACEISTGALKAAVTDELASSGLSLGPRQILRLAAEHPRFTGPSKRHDSTRYYRVAQRRP